MMSSWSPLSIWVLSIVVVFGIVAFLAYWRSYPRRRAVVLLIVTATLASIASLFLSTDIAASKEGQAHLQFGWPLTFVTQDQQRFDPPFPFVSIWQWEVHTSINWPKMAGCIAFYMLFAYLLVRLGGRRRSQQAVLRE